MKKIYLVNCVFKINWGHIRDYLNRIGKILQYKKVNDFILSTKKTFSVGEFVQTAFSFAKIKIIWKGKGINEKEEDKKMGKFW